MLSKVVGESGRVLGRPMDSKAGGSGVPGTCKLTTWQPKQQGDAFQGSSERRIAEGWRES